jgi:hypothetical protein
MIKALPFVLTTGSEKFKNFLSTPFTVDMLYPIYNDKSCETLFDCWRGKNMVNWYKFTNEDKIILEFYPNYYTVKRDVQNSTAYMISIPNTIDEFINDMYRFGIELYWTTWIDFKFEPKEYLHTNEIKPYFEDLLGKMGKTNELL